MPEWMKTTGVFLLVMICWDVVRIFIQAWVNKKVMSQDFARIEDAVEDVEEALEENGDSSSHP